jgi:HlyD family secretion protein
MAAPRTRRTWAITRPLAAGLLATGLLLASLSVWSTIANIAGAVLGTGHIEVTTTRTAVQHPIGGVVVEILKRDGDTVKAGDVVLRLDDRQLQSDLTVTEGALWETLATIARLEAALGGTATMHLPAPMTEALARNPALQDLLDRQQQQLDDHFAMITNETALLEETNVQTRFQIDGVTAQLAAQQQETAVLEQEVARAKDLEAQGLIRQAELATLEKSAIGVRGEIGRLQAQIAELRGKITQTNLSKLSVSTRAHDVMGAELSRLRPERTRLMEARNVILQELSLLDVRAPVNGRIIDSQVQGLRSVVVAASPVMMIVPQDEPILARVRIDARDIDQVFVGQEASLRFTAFNGRQVPIILGRVLQVSADAFVDPATQANFYDVAISLDDSVSAMLDGAGLIPGMPVEAHLATQSRTPLDYVLRPIRFYFDRAFRDA